MTTRQRYDSLDFWRGVACLSVVLLHSSLYFCRAYQRDLGAGLTHHVAHGLALMWLGVPIFFVISGYCIAATCMSTRRTGRVGIYFWRRFRRIYPPFWIFLALTAGGLLLLGAVVPAATADAHPMYHPGSLTASAWLGNVTLTESWLFHFLRPEPSYFVGHAWTLCYEEQFYLLCGLILVLAAARFFSVIAAITVAVLALVATGLARPGGVLVGTFADGHWLLFGSGALVYYVLAMPGSRRWLGVALAVVAPLVGLLLYSGLVNGRLLPKEVSARLLVGLLFVPAVIFLHRFDGAIIRSRVLAPITFCGKMTYSLYLVHYPVTETISRLLWRAGTQSLARHLAITVPICVSASVLIAYAFHRGIERRFLNQPLRSPESAAALAPARAAS